MRLILNSGLVIMILGVSSFVFADVLYLRNGEGIEGKILQSNENWTVITTGIKTVKYDASQIDRVEIDEEDAVEPKAEALTDDKRALIKGLLKANGIQKMIEKNAAAVLAKAPAERQAELTELFKTDTLTDLLVPVYAEKFSIKELEKMVNFFNSPAGKKFIEVSPAVLEETFKVLMDYFKSHVAL